MVWGIIEDINLSHEQFIQVIDGLPAEFVLGKEGQPPSKAFMEAMPYTQSLLANGMGVGYHAVAAAPTVTMPRLKVSVIPVSNVEVCREHMTWVSFFFFQLHILSCVYCSRPWFLEQ